MNRREFEALEKRVRELERERDRKNGELEAVEERLREVSGCEDAEDAESLLLRLGREESRAKAKLDRAAESFREKWGSLLDS